MRQPQMFDAPVFGTHPDKLHRSNSTDTSVLAANSVNTTKLEQLVYEAIKLYGAVGCIQDELLSQFQGYPYSSITARFRALLDKGLIEDTGMRRAGKSGRQQRVLRATNAN